MTTYTVIHVALGLAGIGSGVVVLAGLLHAKRLDGWTALFLATTAATTITGFGFPFHAFLPVHGVGIASVVVLAAATFARYGRRMAGVWRSVYVGSGIAALYLNVVVLVAQLFMKVPALAVLAPTLAELPFLLTQLAVLVLFVGLGIAALRRLRHALPN
jgi:hypothetical protein